ncbi:MAG: S-adenosylmethionine:tRNA ribosyltransferase-isomerase [Alphaproteobacteria bacterium MarineAlpha2_Bin1]|nr:MAG: S-adenosylmethionine:tRNA ribosyltransferase-isomerase [Alphaproteobacteria bacterium MarineAlpha2_Bin1]
MQLNQFNYDLPKKLIADRPAYPRDNSKLLKVRKGNFEDSLIKCIPKYFSKNDLIIFNDTKVIKSRLIGYKSNRKFEVLLINNISSNEWKALVKPYKKVNVGDNLVFGDNLSGYVLSKENAGLVLLNLNCKIDHLSKLLDKYGSIPIPPYIQKMRNTDERDDVDYQSIFAKNEGSVASPTASLHFTESLLNELISNGVQISTITLHIGLGTFLPVKVENINDHIMHDEYGEISMNVINKINDTKSKNGRIISVGTSTMRILETAFLNKNNKEFKGNTNIFIKPGFKFNVVDILLTNFHLPKSTLLMLVCAFAGKDNIFRAYRYAIENEYRFYSYGDAMLLYRT